MTLIIPLYEKSFLKILYLKVSTICLCDLRQYDIVRLKQKEK